MKPVKLMIAIVLGGAVTFQSCKKNDNNYMATPAGKSTINTQNTTQGTNNLNSVNAFGVITCQLTTLFPNTAPGLQWTSGYITANQLVFNGTHVIGNMLSLTKFPAQISQTIQLSKSAALGNIDVTPGKFDYGSISLMLSQSGVAHGLFVSGLFNRNNNTIPVQIMIDDQEELRSSPINSPVIANQDYSANLILDIGRLTKGITGNNLSAAVVTDGTVFISATSNTNLYQMVKDNLVSSMQLQFFTMQANPVMATAPAATR
jgi:hypothetical protein